MPSTTPLSKVNYASCAGFALYPILFSAFEFIGISTLPSNAEISERYQTLITPAGWSFAIWGIIFLFELVYILVQLFPQFRAHRMVRDGVGYWFFVTFVSQFFWSLGFGIGQIIMASLVMAIILFTLVKIVASQYWLKSDDTHAEFWLLRFPFHVHCGWIIAAFAVNANVAAVEGEANSSALFALAILSIIYLIAAAAFCLYALKRPNLTIPLVLAWATFGIAMELRSPMDSIERNFTGTQIAVIRIGSAAICVLLVIATIVRAIWKLRSRSSSREISSGSTTGVAEETSMQGIASDPGRMR